MAMGVPLLDTRLDEAEPICDVQDDGIIDLPGHIRLWRSVVNQALTDAVGKPGHTRDRARLYLTKPSPDLPQVLDFAGIDDAAFVEAMRRLRADNWWLTPEQQQALLRHSMHRKAAAA
jgi:hypothetical protein